jgi:hypothetical protein
MRGCEKGGKGVYLVCFVDLVYLVDFVGSVGLVYLVDEKSEALNARKV